MSGRLHIVASCADRKRGDHEAGVRLRDFTSPDPYDRADRWWSALRSSDASTTSARDLYIGPYWSTVRDLDSSRAASSFDLRLWVASAGYGLVPAEAALRPYSATFSAGMPDSVVRPLDVQRGFRRSDWWSALARKPRPTHQGPRTLAQLADRDPRARMLVIGSPSYLAAIEDDLVEAMSLLGRSERLVIISGAPGPRRSELRQSWVASTAPLLSKLGGALPSLHARLARRILDDAPKHGVDSSRLQLRWRRIADHAAPSERPERAVCTDSQVKSFIWESLRGLPNLTHTRALRDLRARGRACEQARFRELFRSVQRAHAK
jgi:hypothetical protein